MDERDWRLRLADQSDAPTLAAMSRDLIEVGLGWQYRTRRIAQLIADVDAIAVVATDIERTLGFAIMTLGDERAHLVLLAVRPSHHRLGLARHLSAWLVESATVAGIATIHVELRVDNKAAYAFYNAIGFAETLRTPGYYRGRETAISMIRMLRVPGMVPQPWRPPTLDKRS
jgi:ribosomal-protein-alanine N-acetyltransferase